MYLQFPAFTSEEVVQHQNTLSFQTRKNQKLRCKVTRHNSKSSFDSCNTTNDGSLSPHLKDTHYSSLSSFDGILDSSDAKSMSSNENHDENVTILNCALALKKKQEVDDTKFKTELCKKFSETGKCPYGKRCKFAHGRTELNEKQSVNKGRYKSKMCASFHNNMFCSYGVRCLFVHEARSKDQLISKSYYEKFATCPELLKSSLEIQKRRRLPVFQHASESYITIERKVSRYSTLQGEEQSSNGSFSLVNL